ncbi:MULTISPECIES: DNA primase family protein [Cohnella]|uniref:DNA primase family protein n=1 Tax=Cohnella TaxID=329857 RepID=UPI0003F860D7|nr:MULTISPECIES: phage/plasmid primase, P4 family [Cohnella]
MNRPAQPDQQQTARFFQLLYGNRENGWLNIWEKQGKKSIWYPVGKLHEALSEISGLALNKHDVYYGVGLQRENKSGTARGKSSDVSFLPGVWMDIDCSEGSHAKKGLPSFREAEDFINSFPLQPSLVVNSGGGYHIYWLLEQGIEITTPKENKQVSELVRNFQNVLRQIGFQHGWEFDNTSDLARILRIPGTLNYKDNVSPKEVKIVSENEIRYSWEAFSSFIEENSLSDFHNETNGSKVSEYPPSDAELILEKCAFLRHCQDEAATLTEPKWFAMINVLSFAENGAGLIHHLSQPHPKYTEKETNDKISRALGKNGIGKPMTCATIQEQCGDSLCRNCPYKDRIKSPIVLGMKQQYPLTDLGNAERFCQQHKGNIRFHAKKGTWMIWDGTRWREDDTEQIIQLAKETVRSIHKECDFTEDESEQVKIRKFAFKSEAESKIRAFLKLAQAEKGIPVLPDELDAAPWKLNISNGVVDLKTGKLLPHDPNYLMTKIAPVQFVPGATCPNWLRFIHRIMGGNQELIEYIQRAIGYSLTGDTSEQVLFLLNGTGRNGKSTLLTTIQKLLGDYAQQTPSDTLMSKNKTGINNDIARLDGIRFVSASETDEGKRLDESLIKQLTGGDKITARFLFREYFEFKPQFKLFLATNHLPNIRGGDEGIWRRIRLIPFEVRIPENEIDTQLGNKLHQELPGILIWAIQGCLKWQAVGLQTPRVVQDATDRYRREMDTIGNFIFERCFVGDSAESTIATLYEDYRHWAVEAGEYVLSQREFTKRLRERGFEDKRIGKNGSRGFRGIKVKPLVTR